MQVFYNICLVVGVIVALLFAALVFLTGKGDAMSGGGSVRTTFKGKASFEDQMSRFTLILGVSFMALMLLIDVLGNRMKAASDATLPASATPAPAGAPSGPPGAPGSGARGPGASGPGAPAPGGPVPSGPAPSSPGPTTSG